MNWKENRVFSVETRDGIFALCQMIKEPYVIVFNIFSKDQKFSEFSNINNDNILFIYAITRQFIKKSNTSSVTLQPIKNFTYPSTWLQQDLSVMKVIVNLQNTYTKEITLLGSKGVALVEKNILKSEPYNHSSGIYDKVILPFTKNLDDRTIDNNELTSLGIYPNLNERLFLCYLFKKNIDPMKDLLFGRNLFIEYRKYIDIIAGEIPLSKLGY